MCSGTDSHLETIEDFVLNQDKIVSYRWLSKKLNIHANTSKQLLYSFCQKHDKESLLVTYLVTGSSVDGVKVHVVSDSQADEVKRSLDRVLSEHVYSVQKASAAAPASSPQIYLADSVTFQSSQHKLSSISGRELEERNFKVNGVEKTGAGVSTSIKSVTSKPAPKTSVSQSKISENKRTEDHPPKKDEDSAQPFSKDKVVTKSPVKNRSTTAVSKQVNKKGSENKGSGIGAFFNKQTENEKKDLTTVNTTASKLKDQKIQVCESLKSKEPLNDGKNEEVQAEKAKDFDLDPEPCDQAAHKTPVGNKKKPTRKAAKKRKKNQEEDLAARKRKRIVLASDSESEQEQEQEEDVYMEEELEEPPEGVTPMKALSSESEGEEIIPPTPFGEKPKKRVRKQVDRTFVDDDGFVITKKEYVYTSCSEDENREGGSSTTEIKDQSNKKQMETQVNKKEGRGNEMDKEVVNEEESKEEEKAEEKSGSGTKVRGRGKGKGEKKPAATKSKSKSPKKSQPVNSKQQSSITSFFKRK